MEHNDNGPAIVSDKYKEWFRYGLHHRIGGPAIIAPEYIAWMENGLLHRDDGPAIIKRGEPPAKYINGVAVDSCDVRLVKNKGRWYAGDVLHHPEEPAVIDEMGNKYWYRFGLLHRSPCPEYGLDRPAVEYIDGCKEYYQYGKPHRDNNRPAFDDVYPEYYLNGMYHRDDGPATVTAQKESWYLYGQLHRYEKPAIITPNKQEWYNHGLLHRQGGPAIEYASGKKVWFMNGQYIKTQTANKIIRNIRRFR
jgi:hypothetical protein